MRKPDLDSEFERCPVHGVDIVQEAVDDAKVNAEMNGITNAQFHAGKF